LKLDKNQPDNLDLDLILFLFESLEPFQEETSWKNRSIPTQAQYNHICQIEIF